MVEWGSCSYQQAKHSLQMPHTKCHLLDTFPITVWKHQLLCFLLLLWSWAPSKLWQGVMRSSVLEQFCLDQFLYVLPSLPETTIMMCSLGYSQHHLQDKIDKIMSNITFIWSNSVKIFFITTKKRGTCIFRIYLNGDQIFAESRHTPSPQISPPPLIVFSEWSQNAPKQQQQKRIWLAV